MWVVASGEREWFVCCGEVREHMHTHAPIASHPSIHNDGFLKFDMSNFILFLGFHDYPLGSESYIFLTS